MVKNFNISPDLNEVVEKLIKNEPPEFPIESINILGKVFTIKLITDADTELADCDGFMELHTQTIGVRPQPADTYNKDTILHESIHAIDEILGLKLKESQVHQLAAGVIALLKQNKELATWIVND